MFARGLHDRVTSAWANGAVCISDMAKDFDGDIKDGENILFYEERNLSSLIRRLKDLDEADAESIAAEGQALYEEKYNCIVACRFCGGKPDSAGDGLC